MPVVAVMEVDRHTRKYAFLAQMDLAAVPPRGAKVVINIEGIGYVFNVIDVHFAEGQLVDVFVMRMSTITDYSSSVPLNEA